MTILLNSLAAIAYAVAAALKLRAASSLHSTGEQIAESLTKSLSLVALLGWLFHTAALLMDFLGFAPGGARFGWSLAVSIMLWSVVAVYVSESGFFKRSQDSLMVPPAVWWSAAAVCLLVLVAPPTRVGAQGITSASLALFTGHWVLGLAAYGLFAAAVLHGLWLQRSEKALKRAMLSPQDAPAGRQGLPLLTLEKLMMRLVWAGFVLLTLSLLLGVVLGEQLSGKALKFDHKTIFSLLAWVVFAALLFAHHVFGLRGKRALRWLVTGVVLLLLGYAGSWFVKDVLLHRS
jgi:ABC-type uncharacterized transport system permease subunit